MAAICAVFMAEFNADYW